MQHRSCTYRKKSWEKVLWLPLLCLVLAFITSSSPATAEEEKIQGQTLTLSRLLNNYQALTQIIVQGLKHYPSLIAAREELHAAALDQTSVLLEWAPELSGSANSLRTRKNTSDATRYSTKITLSQPLIDLEKIFRYRSYRATKMSQAANLATEENQFARNLCGAYFEWLLQHELNNIYQTMSANSEGQYKIIKAQVEAGQKLEMDLLEIDAQKTEQTYQAKLAANNRRKAMEDLLALLGSTSKKLPDLSKESINEIKLNLNPDSKKLVAQALENSPAIADKKASYLKSHHDLREEQSTIIPDLTATGTYNNSSTDEFRWRDESDKWEFGLNLSFPLGGPANIARRRAARARLKAAKQNLKQERRDLSRDVQQKLLDLESKQRSIVALEKQVKQRTEVYRIKMERYNAGEVSMSDMVRSQNELLDVQIRLANETVACNLLWIDLWQLTGGFNKK